MGTKEQEAQEIHKLCSSISFEVEILEDIIPLGSEAGIKASLKMLKEKVKALEETIQVSFNW